MKEVFRGWKRRVGIALLTVACGLCCVWLRSLDHMDLFFWSFGRSTFEFTTHVNGLVLNWSESSEELVLDGPISIYWHSYCWVTVASPTSYKLRGLTIPYWSIVLPLALLSAWLLLSKTSIEPAEGHGVHED